MTATCYGCPRPAGKDGSAPCICNLPMTTTDRRDADDATFAAAGADQPTLRDQFAGVLPHRAWCGTFHAAIRSCTCLADRQHDADLLLPLIEADRERAKAEAAAEAVETAATDAGLPGVFPSTQRWLLARAAALRSNAGGDRS